MAVYHVHVLAGNGTVVVDHADTVEMGGGYHTDAGSYELAQSYARTGVIQAVQQGYGDVFATITRNDGFYERIDQS
jgi:hypothetical protein